MSLLLNQHTPDPKWRVYLFLAIVITILFGCCMLTSGCYSTNQCIKHCSDCLSKDSIKEKDSLSVSTDSLRKQNVKRDTIRIPVYVPGPIQYIANPCSVLCDSIGNLKAVDKTDHKNGMTSHLFTRNDSLIDECHADSILLAKELTERELQITKRIYHEKLIEKIKQLMGEKKNKWNLWLEKTYKYSAWFLYFCITIILLFLLGYWYLHRGLPHRK